MKQWFSIFSAVLLAALIVFMVARCDSRLDREARVWETESQELIARVKRYHHDPALREPMRIWYDTARAHYDRAPRRAKKLALEMELDWTRSQLGINTASQPSR
jgi:hypothetical protein